MKSALFSVETIQRSLQYTLSDWRKDITQRVFLLFASLGSCWERLLPPWASDLGSLLLPHMGGWLALDWRDIPTRWDSGRTALLLELWLTIITAALGEKDNV